MLGCRALEMVVNGQPHERHGHGEERLLAVVEPFQNDLQRSSSVRMGRGRRSGRFLLLFLTESSTYTVRQGGGSWYSVGRDRAEGLYACLTLQPNMTNGEHTVRTDLFRLVLCLERSHVGFQGERMGSPRTVGCGRNWYGTGKSGKQIQGVCYMILALVCRQSTCRDVA